MRLPFPSCLRLLPLVAFALCCARTPYARAHCAGPSVPIVQADPVPLPVQTEWIYPLRWSWLHWWEANRDLYLIQSAQKVNQEVQPDVLKAQRAKAVKALTAALGAQDWQVRSTAAFALGQMQEQAALADLMRLAQGDSRAEVQQTAVLAIGLLNSAEAEKTLTAKGRVADIVQLARAKALGLLMKILPATAKEFSRPGARIAMPVSVARIWMLSQLEGAATTDFYFETLKRTDNPWLAAEAMIALGKSGNQQTVNVLADVLLVTEMGQTLPVWRRLESVRLEKLDMAGTLKNLRAVAANTALEQFYREYLVRFGIWHRDSLAPSKPDWFDRSKQLYTLRLGWEEIYEGNLRAAAAIALGHMNNPRARQALLLALQQDGAEFGGMWQDVNALARAHEFSNLHKGMVLMSLGLQSDPACLDALLATLDGRIVCRVERSIEEQANSPLRGYAALALGLYAKPVETPQGQEDRPGFERVCEVLSRCAANPDETSEVRAAATLALGLTGRTDNLRRFAAINENAVRLRDSMQIGYGLLARAMLGDQGIVKEVQALLAVPETPDSTADLLSRRAAVLALGVGGAQENIPVLTAAWHQSYYVNREISYALALCRAYSATDSLVEQLTQGENFWSRSFGARCLADLFMPRGRRRIARMLNLTNYAMRNNSNLFFQGIANEFLTYLLIPSFGEIWY